MTRADSDRKPLMYSPPAANPWPWLAFLAIVIVGGALWFRSVGVAMPVSSGLVTPLPSPSATLTPAGTATPVLVKIQFPPTSTPPPTATALPSPTPRPICGESATPERACVWPTTVPTPKPPLTPFPDCGSPTPGLWCTWKVGT